MRQDSENTVELSSPPEAKVQAEGFIVQEMIAFGATASVYRAKHILLDHEVALKVLNIERDNSAAFERFQNEARILTQLMHPNIAKVTSFGALHDGRPFLAMELIEGESLDERLKKGPLDSLLALSLIIQVCEGLELLHENGIVHRDLKPGNIMICSDKTNSCAKIIDLGLATDNRPQDMKLTKTGQILGSAAYMSPEQCRGEKADQRSDIYALGCVLYECLSGKPPFLAENNLLTMHCQINDVVPPLEAKNLLPGLDQIVYQALQKSVDLRQKSVSELKEQLQKCLSGELSSRFLSLGKAKKKGKMPIVLISIAALVSSIVAVSYLISSKEKADPILKVPKEGNGIVNPQLAHALRLAKNPRPLHRAGDVIGLGSSETIEAYWLEYLRLHPRASAQNIANARVGLMNNYIRMSQTAKAREQALIVKSQLEKLSSKSALKLVNSIRPNQENESNEELSKVERASSNLESLAKVHAVLGDNPARNQACIQRMELMEQAFGKNDNRTIDARFDYSRALAEQRRLTEQEVILKDLALSLPLYRSMFKDEKNDVKGDARIDENKSLIIIYALLDNQRSLHKDREAEKLVRGLERFFNDQVQEQRFTGLNLLSHHAMQAQDYKTAARVASETLKKLENSNLKGKALDDAVFTAANIGGGAYFQMKDFPNADRLLSLATQDRYLQGRLTEGVADTIVTHFQAALALKKFDSCKRAIDMYRRVSQQIGNPSYMQLAIYVMKLDLNKAMGVVDKALMEQAKAACLSLPSSGNLEVLLNCEYLIAMSFYLDGQAEQAKPIFDDLINRANSTGQQLNRLLFLSRIKLAELYFAQKNYRDAQSHLDAIKPLPFLSPVISPADQAMRVSMGFLLAQNLNNLADQKFYLEGANVLLPILDPSTAQALRKRVGLGG